MSDQVNKEYQATFAATLKQQIMDPNFPKNEREWWAADRIEQLEAALREISLMDKQYEHDLFSATCVARAALEERT